MTNHGSSRIGMGSLVCILVTGIGVGCLVGLSVSPVVSIVITTVVGSAAAIVAALSGLEDRASETGAERQRRLARWRVNPLPLALLVTGLLAGSLVGILARNNHWFGSDVSSEIQKWTGLGIDTQDARNRLFETSYPGSSFSGTYTQTLSVIEQWTELGLPREEVVRRLFERTYPSSGGATATTGSTGDSPAGTYLFAVGVAECDSLLAAVERSKAKADDEELIVALKSSTSSNLRKLPTVIPDVEVLRSLVEGVLCAKD